MTTAAENWDESIWLTTIGVMKLLGVDRSKVRRMQAARELPFVRDERGGARFPRKEIEAIAHVRGCIVHAVPGKVAAKAFTFFHQGMTWQLAMVELGKIPGYEQPVEVVKRLYQQYLGQDEEHSASATMIRGIRRPSQPAHEDSPEDDQAPFPDADEWRREQDAAARLAQAKLDEEQRAWEEAQRKRAEEAARSLIARPSLAKASPSEEEQAPLSDRLAFILQVLAGKRTT